MPNCGLEPPFFLYVHYLDPHAPTTPVATRGLGADGLPPRPTVVSILELEMENFRAPATLLRDATDLYDGEVWRADKAIGECSTPRLAVPHDSTLTS